MRIFAAQTKAYWTTAYQLLKRPQVVHDMLDVPLQQAVSRCWWFTGWTVMLITIWVFLYNPSVLHPHFARATRGAGLVPAVEAACFVGCVVFGTPLVYGFLRLYTLITHVLTFNIFNTRGQRLRLLNVETTLLPLTACAVGIAALLPFIRWVAVVLFIVLAGYLIGLLGYGYNLIFHKQKVGGLALWFGSTVLTWFVLAIGALAMTVAAAVVAFLGLLVLRPFLH